MRIRLIAISSTLLLGLAFVGHDAMAQSRGKGGSGGPSSGSNRGGALGSPSGATARSGNAARSGVSRSGKAARARKSGDIECTSYGWCRPTPCPAGKKADGTCW